VLIGVDASRATVTRRTGTERYSLEIIRSLLALGGQHDWRLYCRSRPAPGLFVVEESAARVEIRVLPVPRLWTHLGLSGEMALHPPDVLFVPAHVLPLWRPRRSLVTIHDLGYRRFPQAHPWRQRLYLDWSTRWSARVATVILADSQATRADLISAYGVAGSKIVVVYPGRPEDLARVDDPARLAAMRARYGLQAPYVLYVGSLQPRKNLARLIQAFARCLSYSKEMPEQLMLAIAGSPAWLADSILREPARLGIAERVRFLGYVDPADLAALLSGATAFVFPSLYEGFGFPVLEAQACGVPVLTSNTSSLPEAAGEGAWLVDPADVDAIADGIRRLLGDEALRQSLIARGYANVQRFSWRRAAAETLQVIEQMGGG
jgi:glycosyltransferase involved in cell wall biosynthesis